MNGSKQPSYRRHPFHNLETQEDWELAAQQLLDEGQPFIACDTARSGIAHYPESRSLLKSLALGLMKVGAQDDARALLEPLVPIPIRAPEQLQQVYEALRTVLPELADCDKASADGPMLTKLDRLVTALERIRQPSPKAGSPDEETIGMLARILKDQWRQTGDLNLARRSCEMYRRGYEITRGSYTGINAAAMSCVIGDNPLALQLAREVYNGCLRGQAARGSDYWTLATMGEAHLLLGEAEQASRMYREAADLVNVEYAWIVSSLQQVLMLQQQGIHVPAAVLEALKPPQVVVFVGHMVDAADRPTPRFPAYMEFSVRAAIDGWLEKLDARIGYCSAACGSDLIFIEAMLARGAEVNIILPFAEEDFLKLSVSFAGHRWLVRYRNAVKQAHSVTYLTEEPFLGDTILFDYMARSFHGYAELRSSSLLSEPHLLAVWDGAPDGPIGGTAHFVSHWPDPDRRSFIYLKELVSAASAPDAGAAMPAPTVQPIVNSQSIQTNAPGARRVKTMLFADVVGYSRLSEARIPAFLFDFWSEVVKRLAPEPPFVNTWGDAIFAVMDSCIPMMQYALSLQAAVKETVWADPGAIDGIDVRIGLHVGPIFEAKDPMTGRINYYGSHVNRAARLEPVTVPGHIYATQQFVALLMAEMSASRVAARQRGEEIVFPFAWEYVGMLSLAKNFGKQAAYHIRRTR